MNGIRFQPAYESDIPLLQGLFKSTVEEICKKDYKAEQIKIWTESVKEKSRWTELVNDQHCQMVLLGDELLAFGSLSLKGEIDFFYVSKDYQGKGLGSTLLKKLEDKARIQNQTDLFVQASITAKSFFLKHGYREIEEQKKVRKNVTLINYLMEKKIQ